MQDIIRQHNATKTSPDDTITIFNETHSPAFLSHLKTAVLNRASVGSASE